MVGKQKSTEIIVDNTQIYAAQISSMNFENLNLASIDGKKKYDDFLNLIKKIREDKGYKDMSQDAKKDIDSKYNYVIGRRLTDLFTVAESGKPPSTRENAKANFRAEYEAFSKDPAFDSKMFSALTNYYSKLVAAGVAPAAPAAAPAAKVITAAQLGAVKPAAPAIVLDTAAVQAAQAQLAKEKGTKPVAVPAAAKAVIEAKAAEKSAKAVSEKQAIEAAVNNLTCNGQPYSDLLKKKNLTNDEKDFIDLVGRVHKWLVSDKDRMPQLKTYTKELPEYVEAVLNLINQSLHSQNAMGYITRLYPHIETKAGLSKTSYVIDLERERTTTQSLLDQFAYNAEISIRNPRNTAALDRLDTVYKNLQKRKNDLAGKTLNTDGLAKLEMMKTKSILKGDVTDVVEGIYNYTNGYRTGYLLSMNSQRYRDDILTESHYNSFVSLYKEYNANKNAQYRSGASDYADIEKLNTEMGWLHEYTFKLDQYRNLAALCPKENSEEWNNLTSFTKELKGLTGRDKELVEKYTAVVFGRSIDDLTSLYTMIISDSIFAASRDALIKDPAFSDLKESFIKLDPAVQYALLAKKGALDKIDSFRDYKNISAALDQYRGKDGSLDMNAKRSLVLALKDVNWYGQSQFFTYALPALLNTFSIEARMELSQRSETKSLFLIWCNEIVLGENQLWQEYNKREAISDIRFYYQQVGKFFDNHLDVAVSNLIGNWQGLSESQRLEVVSKFKSMSMLLRALPLPLNAGANTEFGHVSIDKLNGYDDAARALELFAPYLSAYPPEIWKEMYYIYGLKEAINDAVSSVRSRYTITAPKFDQGWVSLSGGSDKAVKEFGVGVAGPESGMQVSYDGTTEKAEFHRFWNLINATYEGSMIGSANGQPVSGDGSMLLNGLSNNKDNLVMLASKTGETTNLDGFLRMRGGQWYHIIHQNIPTSQYEDYYVAAKLKGALNRVAYEREIRDGRIAEGFIVGYNLSTKDALAWEKDPKGGFALGWLKSMIGVSGGMRYEIRKPAGEHLEGGFKTDVGSWVLDMYSDLETMSKFGGRALKYGKDFSMELQGYKIIDDYGTRMTARYGKVLGQAIQGWTILQVLKDDKEVDPAFVQSITLKNGDEIKLGWTPEAQAAQYVLDNFKFGIERYKSDIINGFPSGKPTTIIDFVNLYTGTGGAVLTEDLTKIAGVKGVMNAKTRLTPFLSDQANLIAAFTTAVSGRVGYQLGYHLYPAAAASWIFMHTGEIYYEPEEKKGQYTNWNIGAFYRDYYKNKGLYVVGGKEEDLNKLKGGLSLFKISPYSTTQINLGAGAEWPYEGPTATKSKVTLDLTGLKRTSDYEVSGNASLKYGDNLWSYVLGVKYTRKFWWTGAELFK